MDLLSGKGESGLVGGVMEAVVKAASDSSSDLVELPDDAADLGYKSGALYESMFVVWMSSTGAEILCLMESGALVVLLR